MSKLRQLGSKARAKKDPAPEQPESTPDEEAELEAQLAALRAKKSGPKQEETEAPEAPEKAGPVEEAEPVEETAVVSAPTGAFGALMAAAQSGGAALDELISGDVGDASWGLFPVVAVSGGDTGGMWIPKVPDDDELVDDLPGGKKPVSCILLAVRLAVTAWRQDKDDVSDDANTPAWSFASPLSAGEVLRLTQQACKKYQTTPKDDRGKFDWRGGDGTGRPGPTLEVLVWLPDAGLVVLRPPPTYGSFIATVKALRSSVCDGQGNPVMGPVSIGIESATVSSRARKWKEYSFSFATPRDKRGADMMESFKAWAAEADDEVDAALGEWVSAQDQPITDLIREKLDQIRKM
jgi:hypothetical protein